MAHLRVALASAVLIFVGQARAASPGHLSEIDNELLSIFGESEKLTKCVAEREKNVASIKKAAEESVAQARARAASQSPTPASQVVRSSQAPVNQEQVAAVMGAAERSGSCRKTFSIDAAMTPQALAGKDVLKQAKGCGGAGGACSFAEAADDYYRCQGVARGNADACASLKALPPPSDGFPRERHCASFVHQIALAKALAGGGDAIKPCIAALTARGLNPEGGMPAACGALARKQPDAFCAALSKQMPADACARAAASLLGDEQRCVGKGMEDQVEMCRSIAAYRRSGGKASGCGDSAICRAMAGEGPAVCQPLAMKAREAWCPLGPKHDEVQAFATAADKIRAQDAARTKAEEAAAAQRGATLKAPPVRDAAYEAAAQTAALARVKEAMAACDVMAQAARQRIDDLMGRIESFDPKTPALEQRRARLVTIQKRFNEALAKVPPPAPAQKGNKPAPKK